VAILALKLAAAAVTGSVALLSDALESVVNVLASFVALYSVQVAGRPADEGHPYGHGKAEHLSALFEGGLIAAAAALIILTAAPRLLNPPRLAQLDVGLVYSGIATVANFAVATVLLRVGRRHESAALEADAHHLFSDVLTSVGVLLSVAAVLVSGYHVLDPLAAIVVALLIVRVGVKVVRRAVGVLMDQHLPPGDIALAEDVLRRFEPDVVGWRHLRGRKVGARRFVEVNLFVHRTWTLERAHDLLDRVELALDHALPGVVVTLHPEPCHAGNCPAHGGSPPSVPSGRVG
jgi:cation diffusion facilitator family transporter